MKVVLSDRAIDALKDAPRNVQRAFEKQLHFLGCGRDEHRCPPPAQIRTGGITAYGSSLGYERGSAHQDMDVEFVGEEATGRRSASVVPSRAAVADCDVVKCAASSDRAVLEIDRAQPSCPEPHDIGSSPPPRVSTTLRRARSAHASSDATPA